MTLVEVLALTQRMRTCRDEWLTDHFPLRDSASPCEPPLISHRHPESALDLDLFLDDDKCAGLDLGGGIFSALTTNRRRGPPPVFRADLYGLAATRTRDLLLRRQSLYPPELQAQPTMTGILTANRHRSQPACSVHSKIPVQRQRRARRPCRPVSRLV